MTDSYMQERISTWLSLISGDDFQNLVWPLLEEIIGEKLNNINAWVPWWWPGDWGIDLINESHEIVFSVYGARSDTKNESDNIKAKMRSDFQKIKEKKLPHIKTWHFVFNRCYWKLHNNIFDTFIADTAKNFGIWRVYDLSALSQEAFLNDRMQDILVRHKVIDEEDRLYISKELQNKLRDTQRIETISQIQAKHSEKSIESCLSDEVKGIILEELETAENYRLAYLKNYIPILLDNGYFSEKLSEIEALYREGINSEERKITKDYPSLEKFENFLEEAFTDSRDNFRKIDKGDKIIHTRLFPTSSARKGCFYQQIIQEFYNF